MKKSYGGQLLALKRVPPKSVFTIRQHTGSVNKRSGVGRGVSRKSSSLKLLFQLPSPASQSMLGVRTSCRHNVTLYLLSDTYLGLDQQIDLSFDVISSKSVDLDGKL